MAITAVHDYDTDHQVYEQQVNITRWSLTINSTGTRATGIIAWHASDIKCCPTQAGWAAGSVPGVWDTTGCGTIEDASYVQCGGCGSLSQPHTRIIEGDDISDEQIQAAADAIIAEVAASRESEAAAVRRGLADDLRYAVEHGDRDEYPQLEGMTEPGIGLAGNVLVAWDYDPRDPYSGDFIEVREDAAPAT